MALDNLGLQTLPRFSEHKNDCFGGWEVALKEGCP